MNTEGRRSGRIESLSKAKRLSCQTQKKELESVFKTWKENLEKVDDVCVMREKVITEFYDGVGNSVWDEEEIFKAKDSTKKELADFLESLSTAQFTKIRDFLEGMPKLSHTITWKCPKCEKEAPMVLEGIEAFFE